MDRREAVRYISILLGGAVIGADAFLLGCKSDTGKTMEWSADDIAYLNEIGETILPRTSTPGAKDADVGRFMTVMVTDCYEAGDQTAFREGMEKLHKASKEKFSADFMKISPEQRKELLVSIDAEAKEYQNKVNDFNNKENEKEKSATQGGKTYTKQKMSPHYFTMMKQLTLLGFFTSQPGMTQAVRYLAVPGRYEGCVPYKKGDKLIV